MITPELEQEMLAYYEERAEEYDELYTGQMPAVRANAELYVKETEEISKIADSFGNGHLIDIACGTGFWALRYAKNCDKLTFIDQSNSVLAICKERMDQLGFRHKANFIQGNVFNIDLSSNTYNCTFLGFILSHFTSEIEENFFDKLKKTLKPQARIMIVDSIWGVRRREGRKKEGEQKRILNDGRPFMIYKKYFEPSDIEAMCVKYHFDLKQLYTGEVFIAAIIKKSSEGRF